MTAQQLKPLFDHIVSGAIRRWRNIDAQSAAAVKRTSTFVSAGAHRSRVSTLKFGWPVRRTRDNRTHGWP